MNTHSSDALHKRTMEMLKRNWDEICPDTEIAPKILHSYARYFGFEHAMQWIPKHSVKFKSGNDEKISDWKTFNKRFREFLGAAYMTDSGKVQGKYLCELLEGKNLWTNNDDANNSSYPLYENKYNEVVVEEGNFQIKRCIIKEFWENHVIKTDKNRKIRKNEEVFWLILAWVYFHGNLRKKPSEMNKFDKLKAILCSGGKDKDINEVIRWCIGCYADMCFLPECQGEEQCIKAEGLIKEFGCYEYMGGIFEFSEYFGYKEKYIEKQLAGMLKKAFNKDVQQYLAGNWCNLLPYVEREWQIDEEDFEEKGDILRGIRYCITKRNKKPKHKGDPAEVSEYMNGTRKGIGEYFIHNQSLKAMLDMPKFSDLNNILNEKTVKICLRNYRQMKKYYYRRLLGAIFVRMWPSKESYFSLCGVQYALDLIEKIICVPEDEDLLRWAETMQSIVVEFEPLLDRFGDGIIVEGDGREEALRKIIDAMVPFCDIYDAEDSVEEEEEGEEEEDDDAYDEDIKHEVVDCCIISAANVRLIQPSQIENHFIRAEKELKFDRDMAISCLYDMFDLYS